MSRIIQALCLSLLILASGTKALEAPNFRLENESTLTKLSQDHLIYLDFWASWCGPCRYTFPFMNELETELGPMGLKVIAVNVDVDPKDAVPFLEKYPAKFHIHYDPDAKIAGAYRVPGMPTSYLIRNGQILKRHIGFRKQRAAELKREIIGFLAKP